MSLQLSRKEFLLSVGGAAIAAHGQTGAPAGGPKVLIVVAHPDDEYAFAAAVYRITHELAGTVDQVVLTNGEGGYRYSQLAESIYGEPLSVESVGRSALPAIRKEETLRAGKILGVRYHWFLEQKDARFTLDGTEAFRGLWNTELIHRKLLDLLRAEQYDVVLTLLPTNETHGHHQAATLLSLEAVADLSEERRPAVIGARPAERGEASYRFIGHPGLRLASVTTALPAFSVNRSETVRENCPLTYSIIANWVIAEHKSQGLFQTETGKHDREQFWIFELSGPAAVRTADHMFGRLVPQEHASLK